MKCIELLNEEHNLIIRMMKTIKAMGASASIHGGLDSEDVRQIVRLIEAYVDSTHETKEELALFPVLSQRVPKEVHQCLRERVFEHNQERSLREGMQEALMTCNCQDFAYFATRLAEFLMRHARREYLLFKDLETYLRPEDDAKIVAEFESIDSSMRPKIADIVAVLESLEQKYRMAA